MDKVIKRQKLLDAIYAVPPGPERQRRIEEWYKLAYPGLLESYRKTQGKS